MKIAIVGTRYLNDHEKEFVESEVHEILKNLEITDVVTGDAPGVDSVARSLAQKYHKNLITHRADWKKHGKSAGPKRNALIVKDADKMYAFWNGESRGTKNSIDQMSKASKPVEIVRIDEL